MKKINKLIIAVVTTLSGFTHAQDAAPESPWKNQSQIAFVQTSGNSVSESTSVKQETTYTQSLITTKIFASYLKTSAENATTGKNEESARRWDAGIRLDRKISDSWSGFLGYTVESDKYAGYQQRHSTDLGAKYNFLKTEKLEMLGEAGYRYVHQNNINDTQIHFNSARTYVEAVYKLNATNSAKLWVEYIPNFDDSEDNLLNTEASLTSALSTLFSLKVAYLVKKDNKPEPGREKIDRTITTALVAQF